MILTDFLTQIANSIRSKDETTEPILASEFPQRILNIPSGGSELPSNIRTGTFTIAEDTLEAVTIAHGLGAITPVIVYIQPDNPDYVISNIPYAIFGGLSVSNEKVVTNVNGALASKYNIFDINVNDTNIVITPSNTTYKLIAGLNYRWFILEESV